MSNIIISNHQFPSTQEYNNLKELAKIALDSGLLPFAFKKFEQVFIVMLKGRELGVPPMQALSHIYIVNNKPAMSAELMLAQIYKCHPGANINFIEQSPTSVIIEASRSGSKTSNKFSFTIEQARQADLLSKETWKKYPENMLRARVISAMARAVFPDALMGVSYTPEELGAEIDIDENGNEIVKIKDVSPNSPTNKNNENKEVKEEKPKEQEPIIEIVEEDYKTFTFKKGPYKSLRFDQIKFEKLDSYMNQISSSYTEKGIVDQKTELYFELYNKYKKEVIK